VTAAVEIDSGEPEPQLAFRKPGPWSSQPPFQDDPPIQFEQWVPDSIEKVFLFFANPSNLPRIMPSETRTELVTLRLLPPPAVPGEEPRIPNLESLAGVGSEIVTSFRPFPFLPCRARWTALITEFEWNHHFADIQKKKGPFKRFQHRHEFSAETREVARGTVVRDVIEYEAGFGMLGDLAQRLFIAPRLKQTFEYRQGMLEKLLG
jgi:ligand-binding SRPBCC domain-containing protein